MWRYLSLVHLYLFVQVRGPNDNWGRGNWSKWARWSRRTGGCRKLLSVGLALRCWMCRMCCRYPSPTLTTAFYCFMWLSLPAVDGAEKREWRRASPPLATSRCKMYDVRRSVHHRMLCAFSTEIFYNQHEAAAKQFCSQKKKHKKKEEKTAERKRNEKWRGKTGANIMPQIIFISCMRLSAQNCLKMRS